MQNKGQLWHECKIKFKKTSTDGLYLLQKCKDDLLYSTTNRPDSRMQPSLSGHHGSYSVRGWAGGISSLRLTLDCFRKDGGTGRGGGGGFHPIIPR